MAFLGQLCRELKDGQTICLSFEFFAGQYELKWYPKRFEDQPYYYFGGIQKNSLIDIKEYLINEFKDALEIVVATSKELKWIKNESDPLGLLKIRLKAVAELRDDRINRLLQ